jgi:hypothetical protein
MIARGGGGVGIMHMGQSGYSMGLEWMGFRSCATKATNLSNTLKMNDKPTHIYISCLLPYNAVYLSPLQVKNKPHEGLQMCNYFWEC